MSPHLDTLSWFWANQSLLLLLVTFTTYVWIYSSRYPLYQLIEVSEDSIGSVMVSVLSLSAVDGESQSGQTKDYKIGYWCFSAKHAALKSKSKDWLAQNQDKVSKWGDMSIHVRTTKFNLWKQK
jgi:hypothetical protein